MTQEDKLNAIRKRGRLAARHDYLLDILAELEKVQRSRIKEEYVHILYHQCTDTRVLGPRMSPSPKAAWKIHAILMKDIQAELEDIEGQLL